MHTPHLHLQIYYLDQIRMSLEVFSIDNPKWHRVLLRKLSDPTDMAISPVHGFLFFGQARRYKDAHISPNITRCNMAGEQCHVIRSTQLGRPVSVYGVCVRATADRSA